MIARDRIRFDKYLERASLFLSGYNGELPFSIYLKDRFKKHKEMGSRDRRMVAGLCYQFFRLGHWRKDLPVRDRILLAAVYFPEENAELLQYFQPENLDLPHPSTEDIFPFTGALSKDVETAAFVEAFRHQPDLFLRVRPGQRNGVEITLAREGIAFEPAGESALRLPNLSAVHHLLEPDKSAVIQDLNSQQTGVVIRKYVSEWLENKPLNVWDCCAGSGGKSIMLHDLLNPQNLYVSDVRESILHNLYNRTVAAGVPVTQMRQLDLARPVNAPAFPNINLLVADVPCTGSGTWSRTPEELYFFREKRIARFAGLQSLIVENALSSLQSGGLIAYITCSVFAAENESNFTKIVESNGLQALHAEVIQGYDRRADTLFVAIARKP